MKKKRWVAVRNGRWVFDQYLMAGIVSALAVVTLVFSVISSAIASAPEPSMNGSESDQVRGIIDRVSRHIIIPADETPSVATVTDLEAVRSDQPVLFANAELGDRVLIWSRQIVVYSESKDIVVAAASLLGAPPTP
jgi:hypothetical protein